jgi:hypothetical protein
MLHGCLATLFLAVSPLLATQVSTAEPSWVGSDATRSQITTIDFEGASPKVLLDSPHRYSAPEWMPNGEGLVINGGGKLWSLPASGGTPTLIPTGSSGWININHAISPDGKTLAFTSRSMWKIPAGGGEPANITTTSGNWGPCLVARWQPPRLCVQPGDRARPVLDLARRPLRTPAHDKPGIGRCAPVFARRALDLFPLGPRRHSRHLAHPRLRHRRGRRQR